MKAIKIHPQDNVAVIVLKTSAGSLVQADGKELISNADIPAGHKIALENIQAGEMVIKYGFPIGKASKDIKAGDWVHSGNLTTNLEDKKEYTYKPNLSIQVNTKNKTFFGFVRSNGDVGIRNEIWIINTVSCVNRTARIISEQAQIMYSGITDGIYSFPHPFGCSQLGDDLLNTQRILAGLIKHPNAAGVLVIGLGCENNHIGALKMILGEYDENRVRFLNAQSVKDEIAEGLKLVGELIDYASMFRREEVCLSKLKVGMKCGGSDAFSGITANPLAGRCADKLTSCGATVMMTEVSEMFGAETILMERCVSRSVFDKTVNMINSFKEYFINHGQSICENPSPGNKEGGITTLEEKSLGCVQKGGTSNLTSVLNYGEVSQTSGLNIVYGPGNDLVACTTLVASGAQIILFTTGRGTPMGSPVPTIKISCTNELFQRKESWMDFNAGGIINGESIDGLGGELFNYIIAVAEGNIKTKNEISCYREIGIFKDGVYL